MEQTLGNSKFDMKFDALAEWKRFEDVLLEQLKITPLNDFELFWPSLPTKTQFYKTKLLPKVANRLGYKFEPEFMLVDYRFLNSDNVPVIFIESENNHESADRETDKLCAVSSPVKVLFLCCEWVFGARVREKFLEVWKKRIATHHKYCELNAIYMIVVGEWLDKPKSDGYLRYYIESFDVFGNQIGQRELVLP